MDQVLPEAAVPGITEVLMLFHERIYDLQRRFLRIIAVGLGAHEDLFESMLPYGSTLTRAIRYPPMPEAPSGEEHVWAGEHADINLITALPRATAPGLQVKTDDGWIDAVAPEGKVIINTGMMLEVLSNGVIPPGVHRVVADPTFAGERYSVVQFCHPTPWTILSPLPSCCGPDTPQRYGAIEAGDKLDEVLYQINLVEDAQARGRLSDDDASAQDLVAGVEDRQPRLVDADGAFDGHARADADAGDAAAAEEDDRDRGRCRRRGSAPRSARRAGGRRARSGPCRRRAPVAARWRRRWAGSPGRA